MLKHLVEWAIVHPESALILAGLVCSLPGAIYALVKTAYQRVTGRVASGGAWTVADVIVETLPNIPGAINRWWRSRGQASIFTLPIPSPDPLLCDECHGAGVVRVSRVTRDAEGAARETMETVACPRCAGRGRKLTVAELEVVTATLKPEGGAR